MLGPPLKKSLFPVQRVAIIVASREAAKSFFFSLFFPLCIDMVEKCWGKKRRKIGKYEKKRKKSAYPAFIGSPSRWTGNKIIFKAGLGVVYYGYTCVHIPTDLYESKVAILVPAQGAKNWDWDLVTNNRPWLTFRSTLQGL